MLLLLMPLFARELEEKGSLREFVGRSLVPITAALLLCTVTMLTAPWLVEALAPLLPDRRLQVHGRRRSPWYFSACAAT